MIKYILWDIDATLLNFEYAEEVSIKQGFKAFKLGECPDEWFQDYKAINKKYWQKLERGEISKQEVLIGRYEEFFGKYGIDMSICSDFNDFFQNSLASLAIFNDYAEEIVKQYQEKYKQFAATNGTVIAQKGKLKKSGLDKILDKIFISEEIGFEKPSVEFFEKIFEYTNDYDKDSYIIIGDSLTSDMQGGKNSGIKTCRYNYKNIENNSGLDLDYVINSLDEIRNILK